MNWIGALGTFNPDDGTCFWNGAEYTKTTDTWEPIEPFSWKGDLWLN